MAWIKRNLFFVLGGVIALGLLGGAGFYIYKGWSRNSEAFETLNEVVGNLKTLIDQRPSPGNNKIDNTKIAREQERQLLTWVGQSAAYFQPIPEIPAGGRVTGATYSGALQKTLDQLRHEAGSTDVALPPKFEFSFTAEKDRVTFAAGGLKPLAEQLGEVKAISEILFTARINALDGIQRVRVSDDDVAGPQSDYIDEHPVTNELAVVVPYVITFRCFTPELSHVIAGFAAAPNTFIIKFVNVQPAGATGAIAGGPGEPPPGALPMRMPGEHMAPSTQPVAGKGGLQTILKEQLLRVVIEVELVKLLPKS